MKKKNKMPKLPQLLDRKFYKTGQTRGADDDEIYQNRVLRSSTVLIPFSLIALGVINLANAQTAYESGFIALVSPSEYFANQDPAAYLMGFGLELGKNAVIFYERRQDWEQYNPAARGWQPAANRIDPLGGNYVARIPATTAREGAKIADGFNLTNNKGAGIRQYEYASAKTIQECRIQLEALHWLCVDSIEAAATFAMEPCDAKARRSAILEQCELAGLLDSQRLYNNRIINQNGNTTCPLCLLELSAIGFYTRMAQAEGRQVDDLTITEINLFHIEELRYGVLNHHPYNLGWGHHHCNVVVKDSGITQTLEWMQDTIKRNKENGYLL